MVARIVAPAAVYSASEKPLPSPAVRCTRTSWPCLTSSATPAGVRATRFSLFLISLGTPIIIARSGENVKGELAWAKIAGRAPAAPPRPKGAKQTEGERVAAPTFRLLASTPRRTACRPNAYLNGTRASASRRMLRSARLFTTDALIVTFTSGALRSFE